MYIQQSAMAQLVYANRWSCQVTGQGSRLGQPSGRLHLQLDSSPVTDSGNVCGTSVYTIRLYPRPTTYAMKMEKRVIFRNIGNKAQFLKVKSTTLLSLGTLSSVSLQFQDV